VESPDPCIRLVEQCTALVQRVGLAAGAQRRMTACVETVLSGGTVAGLAIDPTMRACAAVTAMQNRDVDGSGTSSCDKVVDACKRGGYYVGGYKQHKGLWWSCVTPLITGGDNPPVTLDPGVADACVQQVVSPSASPFLPPEPGAAPVPGIPDLPDMVSTIPFYWKPNETALEQTKVVITAEVDGLRGNFVVDLGAPRLNLNRTFLQPSARGGVEAVTDANRAPETGDEVAHVTMRLGTLVIDVEDPWVRGSNPRHINAFLNHMWGNFSWVFAPRLGNISLTVLEPFETIIDYTHRRVVLIRLDKQGHRMAKVPAYQPKLTVPLFDLTRHDSAARWWGIAVRDDNTLDTLDLARNTQIRMLDTGDPTDHDDVLGHPFLHHLGVFGVNHRTHQLILYR
jgi:hypothetical protein